MSRSRGSSSRRPQRAQVILLQLSLTLVAYGSAPFMASLLRPSLLRQTCVSVAARRTFTKQVYAANPSPASLSPRPILLGKPSIQSAKVRYAIPGSIRVAAFHVTARRAILPPGPQVIEGTANDAAPIPTTSPAHGSYHWTFERLLSAALIPLTVAPFAAGSLNPVMDAVLCGSILIHSHIGFESIIIDYIPGKRLPKTRAAFNWALRGATLLVGVGLYEFETNDVGLTEAIKRIWTA